MKILLIDDHPVVTAFLSRLLVEHKNVHEPTVAHSFDSGVKLLKQNDYDLVILDLCLGPAAEFKGLELISKIKSKTPETKVIVFSVYCISLVGKKVEKSGASAYIMKNEPIQNIITAFDATIEGEKSFNYVKENNLCISDLEKLSDREFQIIQMIGKGLTPKSIADKLSLSTKTIESHRVNIRRKLDVETADELSRLAHDLFSLYSL